MIWLYLILCSPNFQTCPMSEPMPFETMADCKRAEEQAKEDFLEIAESPDAQTFIALSYCVDREMAAALDLPLPEARGI